MVACIYKVKLWHFEHWYVEYHRYAEVNWLIDWLIDCISFNVPLENFSLIWRGHRMPVKGFKFRPILGTQGHWAVRVLYCASAYRDTGPMFLRSYPKDPWLSPLMLSAWRRNSHYLFLRLRFDAAPGTRIEPGPPDHEANALPLGYREWWSKLMIISYAWISSSIYWTLRYLSVLWPSPKFKMSKVEWFQILNARTNVGGDWGELVAFELQNLPLIITKEKFKLP